MKDGRIVKPGRRTGFFHQPARRELHALVCLEAIPILAVSRTAPSPAELPRQPRCNRDATPVLGRLSVPWAANLSGPRLQPPHDDNWLRLQRGEERGKGTPTPNKPVRGPWPSLPYAALAPRSPCGPKGWPPRTAPDHRESEHRYSESKALASVSAVCSVLGADTPRRLEKKFARLRSCGKRFSVRGGDQPEAGGLRRGVRRHGGVRDAPLRLMGPGFLQRALRRCRPWREFRARNSCGWRLVMGDRRLRAPVRAAHARGLVPGPTSIRPCFGGPGDRPRSGIQPGQGRRATPAYALPARGCKQHVPRAPRPGWAGAASFAPRTASKPMHPERKKKTATSAGVPETRDGQLPPAPIPAAGTPGPGAR